MKIRIKECPFAEATSYPEFKELAKEYDEECNSVLPMAKPDAEQYAALERAGIKHGAIAVTDDSHLAGTVSILVTRVPHYDFPIATVESIFVFPKYRKIDNIGRRLLGWAQDKAKSLGAKGLYISAPVNSRLERLLSLTARKTNSVFFIANKEPAE